MHDKTFADLYCEQRCLTREQFVADVFRRTLYAHARLLAPILRVLRPQHFAADYEFINGVGLLRRFRDYALEAEEFAHHPDNRGILRVTLNLRISSRRMRRLLRTTLHPELTSVPPGDTRSSVPFGGANSTESAPTREAKDSAA